MPGVLCVKVQLGAFNQFLPLTALLKVMPISAEDVDHAVNRDYAENRDYEYTYEHRVAELAAIKNMSKAKDQDQKSEYLLQTQ